MRLFFGGVILCFINPSSGGWLRDFLTPKGWKIGDGLVLHLANSRYANSTFLERYSIMMDYSGYGFGVTKIPHRKALEVDLYTPRVGEARGSRVSAFSLIIGYKLAAIVAVVFSAMGALVLKALIAAKIAAVTSLILVLSKLFHHREEKHASEIVEFDHLPELHAAHSELSPAAVEYYPSNSGSYSSFANLPAGIDYAAPEMPGGNSTLPDVSSNQQVARRRDAAKRRKVPLVTIHQYSNS